MYFSCVFLSAELPPPSTPATRATAKDRPQSVANIDDCYTDARGAQAPLINPMLCYIAAKRSKVAVKDLKEILVSFYTVDQVGQAKDQIWGVVNYLKMDGAPRFKKRYASKEHANQKITNDTEDILALFNYFDEQRLEDRLPTFVVDRPDAMPSQPIMEGEMGAVLAKLLRLEEKCEVLQATVDDLTRVAEMTKKDVARLADSRDFPPV